MQALQLYPHIHAHDASLLQNPSRRWNSVHDLLVDRRAQRLGKAVESLERWHSAFVAADEPFGLCVEILGAHPRTQDLLHSRQRSGDDSAGAAHDIDFTRGLEGNHLTCQEPVALFQRCPELTPELVCGGPGSWPRTSRARVPSAFDRHPAVWRQPWDRHPAVVPRPVAWSAWP